MAKTPWVIFSDLDGTLLDHHTYDYSPACQALEDVIKREIPLIFSSSKTLPEIRLLQSEMNISGSCIAENGSVVAFPESMFDNYKSQSAEFGSIRHDGLVVDCPGGDRKKLVKLLGIIRSEKKYDFIGFSDLSSDELADLTGLDRERALLANQRMSTEPILWKDTASAWNRFDIDLQVHGYTWVQGGRFISISKPFDKQDGVKKLIHFYSRIISSPVQTIGLGDSPNDKGMLDMMDIAVIIESEHSKKLALNGPKRVIQTREPGPRGWQKALDLILAEHIDKF